MSNLLPFLPYMWIGLGVILLVVELLKAYDFTLWLAIDAFVVCIVAFLGVRPLIQVVSFVGLGVVLLLFAKRASFFTLNPLKETQSLRVKPKELIGKRGLVLISIRNGPGNGLVSLNGVKWVAISDNNSEIDQGREVEVVSVRGLKVLVRPVQDAAS